MSLSEGTTNAALPIDDIVPAIRATLAGENRLVLAAPPGAGKTTRVPLALLDEPWLAGKILLLEPRRIAARMAAERMAKTLGERVGETVGLSTRIDRKVSKQTRIEVVTDGLFTRRMLSDPELSRIGAVLFDEFHERSLNLDLGLALALDAQASLRPDLRLVLMSATLDAERIARAIAAPVIASEGRLHPVETIYVGRGEGRIENQTARAVRRALREQRGSVLVFLPGMGEILRTAEHLDDLPDDIVVAPLYGALSPAEQDSAVAPAPAGKRKIVLATDIAESSLTIEGVSTVIDAGLARIAEYDPAIGSVTLVTRRAARANVDQRRGRAGRTGPGVCYRLWDTEATRGLPAEPVPEILSGDLSGVALALAEWGVRDPMQLSWIDTPPPGRFAAARKELERLGALDTDGGLTKRGRDIAALPLAPRLAAMIAGAGNANDRALAAEIAAMIGERGLGGQSADLRQRLSKFRNDPSPRARVLRAQAAQWANGASASPVAASGRIIARALPMLIARADRRTPGKFLTASGRAAMLDASDPLRQEDWLAIADLTGAASGARVVAAAPLSEADALSLGAIETAETAEFDIERRTMKARRVTRLGAIVLSETPLPAPSSGAARAALLDAVRQHGLGLLASANAVDETLARIRLGHAHEPVVPLLTPEDALRRAEEWLAPLLSDPPRLDRPNPDELRAGLLGLLDWSAQRRVAELAPLTFTTPGGRKLSIDYLAEAGPTIEARAQEFFGMKTHPAIAQGRVLLGVSLLSPARRQIALTKDLAGFWSGAYRDMAKDMRGRYPKHDWPDDPANAAPHEGKTKARLRR